MRDHKLIRLYIEAPIEIGHFINCNQEQSHYISNVMRRKISDNILIFNGSDGEFLANITIIHKNGVELKVIEQTREQTYSPEIKLLYAPVKNAKNEFIVQKATEMGVSEIQPINTDRTIRDKANTEKLDLVAIEAAEQCERLDVPQINNIKEFEHAIDDLQDYIIIVCDETGKGRAAAEVLTEIKNSNIEDEQENFKYAIVIGPEGGFSPKELEYLRSLENVFAIGLGPRILRAETAIITALALVQNYLGDYALSPDFRQ
jgi:16S rRNA (uracil1498-N3)-methyltransferase